MFCNNCGTEIKKGDVFCGVCGTRIEENVQPVEVKKKEPIKIPKKAVIIGGIASLVIVIAITVISVLAGQVSLKKFIPKELTFEGVNGYGTIQYDFIDYDSLENELYGTTELSENDLLGMSEDEIFGLIFGGDSVSDYIDVTISENVQNGNLSNGDVVTVTVIADYDAINNLPGIKKKLIGKDEIKLEYTVEGLKEPVRINVFEMITKVHLDLTKTRGNTSVDFAESIEKDGYTLTAEIYDSYYYDDELYITVSMPSNDEDGGFDNYKTEIILSSSSYNSETDRITLCIDDEATRYVEEGIIFEPTSMEFDVDTVDYAKSASNLSANSLSLLKTVALETEVDEGYELSAALFVANPNRDNGYYAVSYLFKGTDGYQVVYFDNNSIVVDESGELCYSDNLTGSVITVYGILSGRHNRVFESIDSYKAYLGEEYTFETITL